MRYIICFLLMNGFVWAFSQTKIIVAKDGTGNFTTIQQAVNSISSFNIKPAVIYIKNGVYYEKLIIDSSKTNLSFIGEDKNKTIITYNDHTGKITSKGDTINTRTSYSCLIQANNFIVKNITFQNDAGFSAGQAVAVEVRGLSLIHI